MVARLKVPHMVTTVRRTLAAGQRHTFTLRPGAELARRLGHAGVHVRSTLTISESGSNGRTHTIVHRTLKL